MLRLFTALTLPPDVAETLKRRQSGLPGARWRPLDALHVTLAFYGETGERRADDLASELTRVTGGPFEIALKGVGCFGDDHRSHTLWAGSKRLMNACQFSPGAARLPENAPGSAWRRAPTNRM